MKLFTYILVFCLSALPGGQLMNSMPEPGFFQGTVVIVGTFTMIGVSLYLTSLAFGDHR